MGCCAAAERDGNQSEVRRKGFLREWVRDGNLAPAAELRASGNTRAGTGLRTARLGQRRGSERPGAKKSPVGLDAGGTKSVRLLIHSHGSCIQQPMVYHPSLDHLLLKTGHLPYAAVVRPRALGFVPSAGRRRRTRQALWASAEQAPRGSRSGPFFGDRPGRKASPATSIITLKRYESRKFRCSRRRSAGRGRGDGNAPVCRREVLK
jgi:hypothetical protein